VQTRSDSTLHGSLGLLEQLRDVAVAVAAEIGELDRFAFARVECREGAADRFCLCQVEHVSFDVVEYGAHPMCVSRFTSSSRGLGAEQVDGPTVHGSQQERSKRPALGIESFGLVPEAYEHLLHDFLGEAAIDEYASGQTEAGVTLPSVYLGECVGIASDHRANQRNVVGST
jgi:hypothetical protein